MAYSQVYDPRDYPPARNVYYIDPPGINCFYWGDLAGNPFWGGQLIIAPRFFSPSAIEVIRYLTEADGDIPLRVHLVSSTPFQSLTVTGAIDGNNKTFSVSPVVTELILEWNGNFKSQSGDYTYSAGTVTMAVAPPLGSILSATGL